MDRVEAEKKIMELVEQIHEVHKQYNPNAQAILISYNECGILINNRYWDADAEYPLDALKMPDGRFISCPRTEEEAKNCVYD